jgi:3-oxoadipate enol-lactonase
MNDVPGEFAAVAGTRLYYEIHGPGNIAASAPVLVLIHGFSCDCRLWDAQMAAWSQTHRVLRYDLRGYGRSALPTAERYSHAGDLQALLEHLGIARAAIAGISMGGWIATHFALTRPHTAAALILLSAALVGWEWSPEWKTLWSAIAARATAQGIPAAKKLWLEHPMFAAAQQNPAMARQLDAMISAYSGWHWLNKDPQHAIEVPDMERLAQLAAPTLIISGTHDFADFALIAQVLQQNISGARALQLPTGHLVNIEAPQSVNRAVADFLQAVAPASSATPRTLK